MDTTCVHLVSDSFDHIADTTMRGLAGTEMLVIVLIMFSLSSPMADPSGSL